jgi:hypothetical protein
MTMLVLSACISARADEPPVFVGVQACAGCHAAEFGAWKSSHHAQAKQPVEAATVLGDLSGVELSISGSRRRFSVPDRGLTTPDEPD